MRLYQHNGNQGVTILDENGRPSPHIKYCAEDFKMLRGQLHKMYELTPKQVSELTDVTPKNSVGNILAVDGISPAIRAVFSGGVIVEPEEPKGDPDDSNPEPQAGEPGDPNAPDSEPGDPKPKVEITIKPEDVSGLDKAQVIHYIEQITGTKVDVSRNIMDLRMELARLIANGSDDTGSG